MRVLKSIFFVTMAPTGLAIASGRPQSGQHQSRQSTGWLRYITNFRDGLEKRRNIWKDKIWVAKHLLLVIDVQ